jgi:serine/threonine protein kinase
MLRQVKHVDGVARLLWHGCLDGRLCVCVTPLGTRLQYGSMGGTRLLALTIQLMASLDGIHEMGVAHRDVKPANIVLDTLGKAHLIDFDHACGKTHVLCNVAGTPLFGPTETLSAHPFGWVDFVMLCYTVFAVQFGLYWTDDTMPTLQHMAERSDAVAHVVLHKRLIQPHNVVAPRLKKTKRSRRKRRRR